MFQDGIKISERKLESKDDKDDDFDNNKEYKSKLIKKKIKK